MPPVTAETLKPELVRFEPAERERDTLWVVFSARNTRPGDFSLLQQTAALDGDKLYLNCERNSWYLDIENAVSLKIEDTLRSHEYSRVFFVGSSMGASGALMFAPKFRPDRVLAFAANTTIGEPLSYSALYLKGVHRELLPSIDRQLGERITVLNGALDPFDMSVALMLQRERPEINTLLMRSPHETSARLTREGLAADVLAAFADDRDLPLPHDHTVSPADLAYGAQSASLLKSLFDAPTQAGYDQVARLPAEYRHGLWRTLIDQAMVTDPRAAYGHAKAAMIEGDDFPYAIRALVRAAFVLRDPACTLAGQVLPRFLEIDQTPRAAKIAQTVARIVGTALPA